MNVKPIKRNFKNVVYNFTDAQVKVREATSNDPWGPSSSLMAEVADMTHNPASFAEIMQMLWKRLNDSGRNWRHVYKALILLEYIIKTGSERVAAQCRENIYVIQTLRDFQYYDKELNKDYGANVREKAKHLCQLLSEEDKLKTERAKALKTRERFQWQRGLISSSGAGSLDHLGIDSPSSFPSSSTHTRMNNADAPKFPVSSASFSSGSSSGGAAAAAAAAASAGGSGAGGSGAAAHSSNRAATEAELRNARPRTAEEEEIQLQLALAMSKEDADKEDQLRRNDDMRLRMAINESQQSQTNARGDEVATSSTAGALDDALIGIFDNNNNNNNNHGAPAHNGTHVGDPWAPSAASASSSSGANLPFIAPPSSTNAAGQQQRGGNASNDLSFLSDVNQQQQQQASSHSSATAAILDAFNPGGGTAGINNSMYPQLNNSMPYGMMQQQQHSNPYAAASATMLQQQQNANRQFPYGQQQQHQTSVVEEDAWSVRSPAVSASVAGMMSGRPNFAPPYQTGVLQASTTGGPTSTLRQPQSASLLDDFQPTTSSSMGVGAGAGAGGIMPHSMGASHTGPGRSSGNALWNSQQQQKRPSVTGAAGGGGAMGAKSKEVEQFLGGHSALVDLDALLAPPPATSMGRLPPTATDISSSSPFSNIYKMPTAAGVAGGGMQQRPVSPSMQTSAAGFAGGGGVTNNNPFHSNIPQSMSMNEQIRSKQQQDQPQTGGGWPGGGVGASGADSSTNAGAWGANVAGSSNSSGNSGMPMPLMPQQQQQFGSGGGGNISSSNGYNNAFQPPPQTNAAIQPTANASYNPFL